MTVGNASGATVRADINSALVALAEDSSGATAPATTFSYQLWADTTAGLLKRRNAANTGWVVRDTLAETLAVSRASDTVLAAADFKKSFVATASFTQTLTAAATLGDGWFVDYRVNSGSTVTLDPNAAETVDGAATKVLVGPCSGRIFCNGSGFVTYGFEPAPITLATEQASTSGTSIDFTGIPAGVKRITIMFKGVSKVGTAALYVQIGDAGGIEITGYISAVSHIGVSNQGEIAAFQVTGGTLVAADTYSGKAELDLENAASFSWVLNSSIASSNSAMHVSAGSKSLSAELDRVRITTEGGTDTFDLGAINISYE